MLEKWEHRVLVVQRKKFFNSLTLMLTGNPKLKFPVVTKGHSCLNKPAAFSLFKIVNFGFLLFLVLFRMNYWVLPTRYHVLPTIHRMFYHILMVNLYYF